ncbi:MAG TPA: extracellular solute-binding protein [Acetobacteraceae bacterium]|nr:extracellular solute-binding protein [Acetobacteraceae bacterium]
MHRRHALLAALALIVSAPIARAAGPVRVLYAGSLVAMMEHAVGPAFDHASGDRFEGYPGGSKALANQIKGKLRRADVFLSASPKVNDGLRGAGNGDWVRWYVSFARSPLVIGYNLRSRFAHDLETKPWWQALAEPGLRLGRTDPALDPKGALTVALFKHAETVLHQPGLAARVLGRPDNPAQVLPEESLVGRLQSGQLDAGFFYSTETAEAHIPTVTLPANVRLQAVYTITVLQGAPDAAAGARFVGFLLGAEGRAMLHAHGLDLVTPQITGDTASVPAALRPVLTSAK